MSEEIFGRYGGGIMDDEVDYLNAYDFLQQKGESYADCKTNVDDDCNLYDWMDSLLDMLDRMRNLYENCGDIFKDDKERFDMYFRSAVYAANCTHLQIPTRPLLERSLYGSYGQIVCGRCLMPIYDRLFDKSDFTGVGNPLTGVHSAEWCPHCGKRIDWSSVNFTEYFG